MTYPRLSEGGCGTVRLHLTSRKSVLIGSLEEAETARGLLTQAVHWFREQQRHDAELADRKTAREMNEANAVDHLDCGGTMRGFTTLPSRRALEDGAA